MSVDVIMSRISAVRAVLSDGSAIDEFAVMNCTTAVLLTVSKSPSMCCQSALPQLLVDTFSEIISMRVKLPQSLFNGIMNAMTSLLTGCQQSLPISEKAQTQFVS